MDCNQYGIIESYYPGYVASVYSVAIPNVGLCSLIYNILNVVDERDELISGISPPMFVCNMRFFMKYNNTNIKASVYHHHEEGLIRYVWDNAVTIVKIKSYFFVDTKSVFDLLIETIDARVAPFRDNFNGYGKYEIEEVRHIENVLDVEGIDKARDIYKYTHACAIVDGDCIDLGFMFKKMYTNVNTPLHSDDVYIGNVYASFVDSMWWNMPIIPMSYKEFRSWVSK